MEGGFKSVMHLSYRNFRSIPEELCGPERHNIEEIYLKENLIHRLPDWFFVRMSHLRFLCLAGNMISSLPDQIDRMVCLETLDLSDNALHGLPPTVGRLQRLSKLLLNGNYIEQLPLELGQLQKLEVLEVRKNRLTTIPVQLAQCIALEDLQVDDNPRLWSIPTRLFTLPVLSYVSAERCNLFQLPYTINTTTLCFVLLFSHQQSLTHCPLALERFAQPDYESMEQKVKRIRNPPCYRQIRCHAVPYLLNLPSALVHLCNRHSAAGILPDFLFETALRTCCGRFRWDGLAALDMPRYCMDRLINGPVASCSSVPCGREIFTTAVLALVKSKEYAHNFVVSVLFCSKLCADRWFQYNCDAYEELSWEVPN
ncbi:leucine-rich repeat-containing protein 1-like [Anopheles moucheti]|uniref:leucine-rich repeat-containing protein 1-like n=1 Tax=Anopheles moucheti TaxID=186751 RepID=UPI0022F12F04|nr:leucine-rich repeat-containing protein 1-like [Anopheles moucheti]